jgi:hypothetical protein
MGTMTLWLLVLQLVVILALPILFFCYRHKIIKDLSLQKLVKVINSSFLTWIILVVIVLVLVGGSGALPIDDPDYPDTLEYYFMSSVGLNLTVLLFFFPLLIIVNLSNFIRKRKGSPTPENLP